MGATDQPTVWDKLAQEPGLLTVARTLQYLPIHKETLYRLVKAKRLSAIRIASRLYFDPAVIADFLRKRNTL
jgi:excisionase family DNA binding protein